MRPVLSTLPHAPPSTRQQHFQEREATMAVGASGREGRGGWGGAAGGRTVAGIPSGVAVALTFTVLAAGVGCRDERPNGAPDPDLVPAWSALSATLLVPRGSAWRYLDDGSNQGTAWRA